MLVAGLGTADTGGQEGQEGQEGQYMEDCIVVGNLL